jgi:hypothetical protein
VTEEELFPALFEEKAVEGENPMYTEESAAPAESKVDVKARESLGTYVSPGLKRLKKTLRNRLPKDKPPAAPEGELTPEQETEIDKIAEEVRATTSPGGLQPVDFMTRERAEALVDRAMRNLPAGVTDKKLGKLYRKFSKGLAEKGITELSPQQFTALPITLKTMFRVNDSGNYELVDTATYAQRVEAEFQRRATATVPTGLGAPLPESTVPGAAVGNPMLVAAEAAAAEAPVRPSLPPLVSDPRAQAGTVRPTESPAPYNAAAWEAAIRNAREDAKRAADIARARPNPNFSSHIDVIGLYNMATVEEVAAERERLAAARAKAAGTVRTGGRPSRKKTFKSRRGKKTNVRGTRRRKDRANRAHKNSRRGA